MTNEEKERKGETGRIRERREREKAIPVEAPNFHLLITTEQKFQGV